MLAVTVGWLAVLTPRFVSPTYTLVSASRSLSEIIPAGATVHTKSAGSLFLANQLRYTEGDAFVSDYVVTAFHDANRLPLSDYRTVDPRFVENFRLMTSLRLNFGDDYIFPELIGPAMVFERSR